MLFLLIIQDTLSVDEDSGIVMPTRSDLEVEVNHSEAGPEIATGLTSSDLRCASQCKYHLYDSILCCLRYAFCKRLS